MAFRSRALRLASALLLASALGHGHAHADDAAIKVRILNNWFAQADQSGYWRTQVNGPTKNGGLDIQVLQGGPKIQTVPQVAAGQAEFGVSNADDILLARLKGAPVKAVFVSLDYVPYTLVYHADTGIKSIADLKTKTVAVALGSAYWEWLKKQYSLRGVREIPVSGDLSLFRSDPNMVQQGYSVFLPYRMTAAGIPNGQFKVASFGYRPYDILFTTDDMIANHLDTVKKTLAAVKQGWADFIQDPSKTRDLILKMNSQVPGDVHDQAVAEMISDLLPHDPSKLGCMVPQRWSEIAAQLHDVKFLADGFDPSSAYDAHLVPGC